jgi:hypothetical protein
MCNRSQEVRPELGCMTKVGMYDQSHDVWPGVRMYDLSHDLRPEL